MSQNGNLYRILSPFSGRLRRPMQLFCAPLVALLSLVANFPASQTLSAAPPTSSNWLIGVPLQAKLDSPVSLRLSGQPLRISLEHLAEAYQVAIFLDRRIDPSQLLDLQVTDVSLETSLANLAEQQGLGVSQVGSILYFGPVEAAKDIRTLAALARDEVDQVPQARKTALLKATPLAWKNLTTPRGLIAQTAASASLKLIGLERVPHDLWPACSWPPMNVTDRLTLLAIGFDLQIRVSKAGDVVELVPRVSPARIVKSYPAGTKPDDIRKKLAEYLPDAEFKSSNGKLFVRARWEDHLQVQAALRGQPLTRATSSKESASDAGQAGIKVYTLSVQNKPLRPVLETLAKQMNLALKMDDAVVKTAGVEPTKLISFQVKGAQRDELWEAALSPIGLSFKIEGDTILVTPKQM